MNKQQAATSIDSSIADVQSSADTRQIAIDKVGICLLYTSDAADELR